MQEEHLKTRILELEAEIAESDDETRVALVSQLERVVRTLEMAGLPVTRRAPASQDTRDEDAVEAQFDNLPI